VKKGSDRSSVPDRDEALRVPGTPPIALSRRDALAALATGGVVLSGCMRDMPPNAPLPPAPMASPVPPNSPERGPDMPIAPSPAVLTGAHTVVPLPFKPAALNGISERMIVSHHDNNYATAVKNLNRVEQELKGINPDMPPFMIGNLRQSELTFRNSKTLHEAYFGNLGGDGKRSGAIEKALGEAYGASTTWEQHFRATCAGLGCGSGWVVLGLELETGSLRTAWSGNHTQTLATSYPLLVLDMYEHAYQMDFGAAAAKYLDAFFANINWDEVNKRYERALRAVKAMHG